MALAQVASRALHGLQASVVHVEVYTANGLPSFVLVGLADTEVREARERVRAALEHSGLPYPSNQRITVNLAPADLPKDSGRFDPPMALGLLAASGELPAQALAPCVWAGELSLNGSLRPVAGALAMARAMQHSGLALVLPPGSAEQAAVVPHVQVIRANSLAAVVQHLRQPHAPNPGWAALPHHTPRHTAYQGPGLHEVHGHHAAKRALQVAAVGGHSVLMCGPPGAGKSMLAQRLPGLLPPLNPDHALEAAAIAELAGLNATTQWGQPPLRAPHHSASAAALVGGGNPPRPGEATLAHLGVLFLDELPEFTRPALEALREPLETGEVRLARAGHRATYPARFMLVAAMNPCPCGYHGSPRCQCSPERVARYTSKISGPLLDRMDMVLHLQPVPHQQLLQTPPPATNNPAQAVQQARARALQRQGSSNAQLSGSALQQHTALPTAERQWAENAAHRLGWSARRLHRVLRVARSVADLDDNEHLGRAHLAEAMQYVRVLG